MFQIKSKLSCSIYNARSFSKLLTQISSLNQIKYLPAPALISNAFQISSNHIKFRSLCSKSEPTFASLFRDSPLCQLGLPEGKIALGEIVDVVDDDLYIDFGFKFNAVCRRPKQNPMIYCRGAIVKVRINDLELSDRFLGSTKDMTLLEADVTLLGLHSSPVQIDTTKFDKNFNKNISQTSKYEKIDEKNLK